MYATRRESRPFRFQFLRSIAPNFTLYLRSIACQLQLTVRPSTLRTKSNHEVGARSPSCNACPVLDAATPATYLPSTASRSTHDCASRLCFSCRRDSLDDHALGAANPRLLVRPVAQLPRIMDRFTGDSPSLPIFNEPAKAIELSPWVESNGTPTRSPTRSTPTESRVFYE